MSCHVHTYETRIAFSIVSLFVIAHPTLFYHGIYRALDSIEPGFHRNYDVVIVKKHNMHKYVSSSNTDLWKEMRMSALSLSTSVKVRRECFAHTSKAFMKTIRTSYGSKFRKFVVRKLQREISRFNKCLPYLRAKCTARTLSLP